MTFEEIIGHRRAVEELRGTLAARRLHHALLLQGPEGIGKGTLARALATALLCGEPPDEEALSKVRHRNHPDLLVIRRISKKIKENQVAPMNDLSPEEERGQKDKDLSPLIRVFQIRQLSERAGFTPREASCRVFILDPADRMNLESQNALLKTLEEPPGQTHLMLVTSRPHLLLPTVRSRCYTVRLAAMPSGELADALEQRGMSRAEAVARATLARGRPGRALSLDLEALGRRREEILASLEQLALSPAALARLPAMVAAINGSTESDFVEGLDLFEELIRDSTRLAAGLDADVSLDAGLSSRLTRLGEGLGAGRGAALVSSIERLRRDLRFHVNKQLLTESLLSAVAGGPLP